MEKYKAVYLEDPTVDSNDFKYLSVFGTNRSLRKFFVVGISVYDENGVWDTDVSSNLEFSRKSGNDNVEIIARDFQSLDPSVEENQLRFYVKCTQRVGLYNYYAVSLVVTEIHADISVEREQQLINEVKQELKQHMNKFDMRSLVNL